MSFSNLKPQFIHNLCKRTLKSYYFSPKTKLTSLVSRRNVHTDSQYAGTAGHAETQSTIQGLSKLQAQELVLRLNDEERNILTSALHEYRSKLAKDEYEGNIIVVLIYSSLCI